MGSNKKSGGWRTNKWIRAALPAMLLHCSIGTVYCWSTFSEKIAGHIGSGLEKGIGKSDVEWAFSLAIFFLGMSAAFLGNVVEKDIHKSSLIAAICFAVGMAGTGGFIWYGGQHKDSAIALIGIYVCYGLIMGIGLGLGYLSPVKTLMLWFSDNKGLATGLAVAGFGAAKAIASPIMEAMLDGLGDGAIYLMFLILSVVYFVMMFMGHLLLKKPDDWHEPQKKEKGQGIWATIKTKPIMNYVAIWLMFYINITCGLAIISQEKQIIGSIGLVGFVWIIPIFSAIFNAGGRLGLSAMGDKMKDRNTIYKLIFITSIAITTLAIVTQGIAKGDGNIGLQIIVLVLIMLVNAGYGGGFSNVPNLLSDQYGMGSISALHGITLSAWGFAGLTGNQMASWIARKFGEAKTIEYMKHGKLEEMIIYPDGYQTVLYVTVALYIVAFVLSMVFVKSSKKEK